MYPTDCTNCIIQISSANDSVNQLQLKIYISNSSVSYHIPLAYSHIRLVHTNKQQQQLTNRTKKLCTSSVFISTGANLLLSILYSTHNFPTHKKSFVAFALAATLSAVHWRWRQRAHRAIEAPPFVVSKQTDIHSVSAVCTALYWHALASALALCHCSGSPAESKRVYTHVSKIYFGLACGEKILLAQQHTERHTLNFVLKHYGGPARAIR